MLQYTSNFAVLGLGMVVLGFIMRAVLIASVAPVAGVAPIPAILAYGAICLFTIMGMALVVASPLLGTAKWLIRS
jgi:hypothetical protein